MIYKIALVVLSCTGMLIAMQDIRVLRDNQMQREAALEGITVSGIGLTMGVTLMRVAWRHQERMIIYQNNNNVCIGLTEDTDALKCGMCGLILSTAGFVYLLRSCAWLYSNCCRNYHTERYTND